MGIAPLRVSALKGRDKRTSSRLAVSRFQRFHRKTDQPRVALVPRLPWAVLSCPFRAQFGLINTVVMEAGEGL